MWIASMRPWRTFVVHQVLFLVCFSLANFLILCFHTALMLVELWLIWTFVINWKTICKVSDHLVYISCTVEYFLDLRTFGGSFTGTFSNKLSLFRCFLCSLASYLHSKYKKIPVWINWHICPRAASWVSLS